MKISSWRPTAISQPDPTAVPACCSLIRLAAALCESWEQAVPATSSRSQVAASGSSVVFTTSTKIMGSIRR